MMIAALIRVVVDQADRKEKVGRRSRERNKNLIQEGRSETIADASRTAERPPTVRGVEQGSKGAEMDLIQNPQPRTDVFGTGTVTNKSTIVILKVQPPLTRSKDKRVEEEKESSTPKQNQTKEGAKIFQSRRKT